MQFYQFAMYNKIYMVVIEPTLSPHMEGEKGWIIDDDLCIIERCKTILLFNRLERLFESFVNSERCKTSPFLIGLVV